MLMSEIVHVAVVPPDSPDISLIRAVAKIIDKDDYTARLLLTGQIPRIVAHCSTMEAAKTVMDSLRSLGLVAMMVKESDLRNSSTEFRPNTMTFEDHGILFRDKSGNERRIGSEDAFLIIEGQMQTSAEIETTDTQMKLNLKATILTGGIPILRVDKRKTASKTTMTEHFVKLYESGQSEPSVELVQSDLDYSFLGADITASSLVNFSNTVDRIKKAFPNVIIDNRLRRFFQADIPTDSPGESTQINCKLIYLQYQSSCGL